MNFSRRVDVLKKIIFLSLVFATSLARADQYFDFSWGGVGGASATGYVAFSDGAIFQIQNAIYGYGATSLTLNKLSGDITDFSITVSGATAGNGTFGYSTFDTIEWTTEGALNTNIYFFYQHYTNPGAGGVWGQPGLSGFYFASSTDPNAPGSTNSFIMESSLVNGGGTTFNLNSFDPGAAPAAPEIDGKFLPQVLLLLGGATMFYRRNRLQFASKNALIGAEALAQ